MGRTLLALGQGAAVLVKRSGQPVGGFMEEAVVYFLVDQHGKRE